MRDGKSFNEALASRRKRAEAFRQRHEATIPDLFEADYHYLRGGPKASLIREIESACRKQPDLAGEIREVWRWTEYEEVEGGFVAA